MRKHTNQPYAHAEIQKVSARQGSWDALGEVMLSLVEESTPKGSIFHLAQVKHAQELGLPSDQRTLQDLSGTWCVCLVNQISSPHKRLVTSRSLRRLASLVFFELSLTEAVTAYRRTPSKPLRAFLLESLDQDRFESPLRNVATIRQIGTHPEAEILTLLRSAADHVEHGVLSDVLRALTDQDLGSRHRTQALAKLMESSWLHRVQRDESELLVGFQVHNMNNLRLPENLFQVLVACRVGMFVPEQTTFYRLPAYVWEFLLRNLSGDHATFLQATPWVADLDLAALVVLWEPSSGTVMCELSQAVDALQRL